MENDTFKIARTSGDRRFLAFIHARMIQHKESKLLDYMQRLTDFARNINRLVTEADKPWWVKMVQNPLGKPVAMNFYDPHDGEGNAQ